MGRQLRTKWFYRESKGSRMLVSLLGWSRPLHNGKCKICSSVIWTNVIKLSLCFIKHTTPIYPAWNRCSTFCCRPARFATYFIHPDSIYTSCPSEAHLFNAIPEGTLHHTPTYHHN